MNKKTLIIIVVIALIAVYFMSQSKKEEQKTKTGNHGTWNNVTSSNTNATSIVDSKGSDAEKAANITDLLNRFVATCNNHGGIWNPGSAAKHGWDTTTLNQILSLNDSSLKTMNTYFIQHKASQCVYPENYSSLKSRRRTSLSDAIPSGTLCKYRTGASTAFAFKDKMKAKGL